MEAASSLTSLYCSFSSVSISATSHTFSTGTLCKWSSNSSSRGSRLQWEASSTLSSSIFCVLWPWSHSYEWRLVILVLFLRGSKHHLRVKILRWSTASIIKWRILGNLRELTTAKKKTPMSLKWTITAPGSTTVSVIETKSTSSNSFSTPCFPPSCWSHFVVYHSITFFSQIILGYIWIKRIGLMLQWEVLLRSSRAAYLHTLLMTCCVSRSHLSMIINMLLMTKRNSLESNITSLRVSK